MGESPPRDLPGVALPWASPAAQRRLSAIQAATPVDLERQWTHINELLEGCILPDEDQLVLYAGTNVLSPAAGRAHAPQLGMRPSMGHPGEKIMPGLEAVEHLEVAASRAVAAAMRARHAEVRPQSGTLANLAVYAALAAPGEKIAVLPPWGGGHTSHRGDGVAGIRGLRILELPYDGAALDVEPSAYERLLERERPALVVLGGSIMLFPHRLEPLARCAHEHGAAIVYDAAHVAGLIAGGAFQDPLAEGADIVTFSTYKSFAGPAGGAVVTDSASLAARVEREVYPGLTANYDAGRLGSLAIAASEALCHGAAYAEACIANARRLARALHELGVTVLAAERGFTETHHIALPIGQPDVAGAAVEALAASGITLSSIDVPWEGGATAALRLGTQELTRRGLDFADMDELAELITQVLRAGTASPAVRERVRALRRRRDGIAFAFD